MVIWIEADMMKGSEKISHQAILLLMVISLSISLIADGKHVSIKNSLGSGKNMTLHCQSKHNDLGVHNLEDGEEFGWDFNDSVTGTTLFFCDLEWASIQQYHFDAYDFGRDIVRCGSTGCSWLISAEGIYGLNAQTGYWEFIYSWPANRSQ